MKMQEELISALADVNRVMEDMAKSQQSSIQLVKPFTPLSGEEREKVMRFLFNLQKSGITNMVSADEYIQKKFGFTKDKSMDYLFDYIDNYTEVEDLYFRPKLDVSEASSVSTATKKRKGPKPYAEMTAEELAKAKAKAQARSLSTTKKMESAVSILDVPGDSVVSRKRTVIRLKKAETSVQEPHEPKPKGVLIWNAFMNTVKLEMIQDKNGEEPSYNEVMKKAQELKEADPISYKLFTDNWSN